MPYIQDDCLKISSFWMLEFPFLTVRELITSQRRRNHDTSTDINRPLLKTRGFPLCSVIEEMKPFGNISRFNHPNHFSLMQSWGKNWCISVQKWEHVGKRNTMWLNLSQIDIVNHDYFIVVFISLSEIKALCI